MSNIYLTPQERKIFPMLLNGLVAKEISAKLNITVRTVKAHAGSIYRKYNVVSRTALINKLGKFEVRIRFIPYKEEN